MDHHLPSYSPPDILESFESIKPRALAELEPPPLLATLPELPNPQRTSTLPGYVLTTHIIPAAYPRSPCEIIQPVIPVPESPSERETRIQTTALQLATARSNVQNGLPHGKVQRTALFNVLNRYTRNTGPGSSSVTVPTLTLVVFHANGFPKEVWEPTLKYLTDELQTPAIEDIWCFESVNHGESALVNQGALGDIFDWADNARDIFNFLVGYMPRPTPPSESLPVHLPSVAEEERDSRCRRGIGERTIIGLGHSFGGCTMLRAAIDFPKFFSSLILVDPVVAPTFLASVKEKTSFYSLKALAALKRRTNWDSFEQARKLFVQSPFFGAWASDVLNLYLQHGLYLDAIEGGVKLVTTSYQEAAVFADVYVAYETWEMLEQLDKTVELFWIMAGTGANVNGGEDGARAVVWRRDSNSHNVRIPGASHLIPLEQPRLLGTLLAAYLQRKYWNSGGIGASRL